uniref:Uncharacterized protein n=1 Tax=Trypanosoma vivax (strain Y486) TaxID=1055687 RepID=G0TRN2_TRYVY|nr:conserved hypothetical protein [Trypanosoma vivax Y486]
MSGRYNEFEPVPQVLLNTAQLEWYLRNLSAQFNERISNLNESLLHVKKDVKNNSMAIESLRMAQSVVKQGESSTEHESTGAAPLPDAASSVVASSSPPKSSTPPGEEHDSRDEKPESVVVEEMQEVAEKISSRTYSVSLSEIDECMEKWKEEAQKRLDAVDKIKAEQERCVGELNVIKRSLSALFNIDIGGEIGLGTSGRQDDGEEVWTGLLPNALRAMETAPFFREFRGSVLGDVSDYLSSVLGDMSADIRASADAFKQEIGAGVLERPVSFQKDEEGKTERSTSMSLPRLPDVCEQQEGVRSEEQEEAAIASVEVAETKADTGKEVEVPGMRMAKASVGTSDAKAELPVRGTGIGEGKRRDSESRLLEHIHDLEERMSLYEAERAEFRHILRVLLGRRTRGHSPGKIKSSGRHTTPCAAAQRRLSQSSEFIVREEAGAPEKYSGAIATAGDKIQLTPQAPYSNRKKMTSKPLTAPVQPPRDAATRLVQHPRGTTSRVSVSCGRDDVVMAMKSGAECAGRPIGRRGRRLIESFPPLPYERDVFK